MLIKCEHLKHFKCYISKYKHSVAQYFEDYLLKDFFYIKAKLQSDSKNVI